MNLTKILDKVFSPITILKKFFDADDYYLFAIIGIVVWAVFVFLGSAVVGPTAGAFFQILAWLTGYLFSLYFHANLGSHNDDLLTITLIIVAAILAGITVGISLHALFLLYFL